MAKKLHPADQAEIEKIATADHFTVHLGTRPFDKTIERTETLVEAILIADTVDATPGGRQPMIYAITPDSTAALVPTP